MNIKLLPQPMGYKPRLYTPPDAEGSNSLSAFEIELLKALVRIPTHTGQTQYMARFITDILTGLPGVNFTVKDGNIYVIKGALITEEYYPCVVAHTDTVHPLNYNINSYINGDVLFAIDMTTTRQFGTGGDDKVGIYIAIMCLLKFEKIKIVFFRDEEQGCVGSRAADMAFFKDVGFVLQADRRGRYDITDTINSTPVLNEAFKSAFSVIIKKYNRVYVNGGMTDIIALVNKGLAVCACNLSCGYYDPHSSNETINLLHVQETRDFSFDLLEGVGRTVWPFPDRVEKKKEADNAWKKGWDNSYYQPSQWKGGTKVLYPAVEFMTEPKDYCQSCGDYMRPVEASEFPGFCKTCVIELNAMYKDETEKDGSQIS